MATDPGILITKRRLVASDYKYFINLVACYLKISPDTKLFLLRTVIHCNDAPSYH
jgi:hypothetical protein